MRFINLGFYVCDICDYKTMRKHDMERHFKTDKHSRKKRLHDFASFNKSITEGNQENSCKNAPADKKGVTTPKKVKNLRNLRNYECEICGISYKHRQNLSRHRNKVHIKNEIIENSSEIIENSSEMNTNMVIDNTNESIQLLSSMVKELLNENKILQEKMIEKDISKNNIIQYNQYNNQINQKNVNIITFLNNDCKDAMNISDFIKNLSISFEDLECIKEQGYIQGIRNSLMKQIKELEMTKRPIHCTDIKRKHFYVKDNDEWDTDHEHKKVLDALDKINNIQLNTLHKWKLSNPQWKNTDNSIDTIDHLSKELTSVYVPTQGNKINKKIIQELSNITHI
jgi:hypothetical protein